MKKFLKKLGNKILEFFGEIPWLLVILIALFFYGIPALFETIVKGIKIFFWITYAVGVVFVSVFLYLLFFPFELLFREQIKNGSDDPRASC